MYVSPASLLFTDLILNIEASSQLIPRPGPMSWHELRNYNKKDNYVGLLHLSETSVANRRWGKFSQWWLNDTWGQCINHHHGSTAQFGPWPLPKLSSSHPCPQILLHSIHPSQFRSAYSSTSFRFEYGKFLCRILLFHSINMACPAQSGYFYIWYFTMSQSVNNEYNSLLYLICQVHSRSQLIL